MIIIGYIVLIKIKSLKKDPAHPRIDTLQSVIQIAPMTISTIDQIQICTHKHLLSAGILKGIGEINMALLIMAMISSINRLHRRFAQQQTEARHNTPLHIKGH